MWKVSYEGFDPKSQEVQTAQFRVFSAMYKYLVPELVVEYLSSDIRHISAGGEWNPKNMGQALGLESGRIVSIDYLLENRTQQANPTYFGNVRLDGFIQSPDYQANTSS